LAFDTRIYSGRRWTPDQWRLLPQVQQLAGLVESGRIFYLGTNPYQRPFFFILVGSTNRDQRALYRLVQRENIP
jgi:hypothetical protein